MNNFHYSIPTKVYFGEGEIKNLGKVLKEFGSNVLLVYGGGSIKRIGVYDEVLRIAKENNLNIFEISGVEPNPRITTVRLGAELSKEKKIDVVLAVGGGSTIDCGKVIAAGACYEGDSWDLVTNPKKILKALPIVSILTLSATGSEMDPFAVISDLDSNNKIGVGHDLLKPKASILDPTYTYSVSKTQTAAGTIDIMSHIFEVYFNTTEGCYMQDRMCEALLKTCIKYGPIAINEPENYEARANLMWTSSLAINGLLSYGRGGEWTVHPMEHELSAFYDITHGVGLGILTPHWMEYVLNNDTLDKFVEYGVNVWGISKDLDKVDIADLAIEKTKEFFKGLGIPMTLKEVGIDEENLEEMAIKACRFGLDKGFVPLDWEDVYYIYRKSL